MTKRCKITLSLWSSVWPWKRRFVYACVLQIEQVTRLLQTPWNVAEHREINKFTKKIGAYWGICLVRCDIFHVSYAPHKPHEFFHLHCRSEITSCTTKRHSPTVTSMTFSFLTKFCRLNERMEKAITCNIFGKRTWNVCLLQLQCNTFWSVMPRDQFSGSAQLRTKDTKARPTRTVTAH